MIFCVSCSDVVMKERHSRHAIVIVGVRCFFKRHSMAVSVSKTITVFLAMDATYKSGTSAEQGRSVVRCVGREGPGTFQGKGYTAVTGRSFFYGREGDFCAVLFRRVACPQNM